MAKKAYIGVDGKARKIKKGYIGVPEFVQPVLTADGTLGGSAFAVYASNYHSTDYAAYKAFNGKASDCYSSSVNPSSQTIYLTFYNPAAIKVSVLKFTNVPSGLTSSSTKAFSVQGSNDNSAWTTIGSFTNTNNTNGATWSVSLSGGFYKYHRLVITSANTTQAYVNIGEIAITATSSESVARKIKKAYIGIGSVARPCWSGGELAYYGTITALSSARYSLAATSNGSYALFGGGKQSQPSNIVDAYNTSLSRSTAPTLGQAASMLAATSIGNYAVFGGGVVAGNGKTHYVCAYNTALTKTTTYLGTKRHGLAATTVGNYALFAGGYATKDSNAVDAIDASLTVSQPTGLSTLRNYPVATTVGNYALFGGGETAIDDQPTDMDAYNASLTRTIATNLSAGKRLAAATTVGNYALFGGGDNYLTGIDVYDASLTRTTPTNLSLGRIRLAATTVGDYALFGGGASSGGTFSKVVDVYDASLTRTTTTDLSKDRDQLTATTIGNYALFGGGLGLGERAEVDAYTVS